MAGAPMQPMVNLLPKIIKAAIYQHCLAVLSLSFSKPALIVPHVLYRWRLASGTCS
jgi:hypothetical protein